MHDRLFAFFARQRLWVAVVAVAIGPFVGGASAVLPPDAAWGWKVMLWTLAGLGAAIGATIGHVRVRAAEQKADAERAAMQVVVNDALTPLNAALNRILNAPTKRERQRALAAGTTAILSTARDIVSPTSGVRACWYELVTEELGRCLKPVERGGRSEYPRTYFRSGTPAGDAALTLVDSDGHVLVEDAPNHALTMADRPQPPTYGTYIAVAVNSGGKAYGMLTVDAPEPGSLTRADEATMWLLGGMLASMIIAADR